METIGIVGLGQIGGALAHRLKKCGVTPIVFDLKEKAVRDAEADGAIAAKSSGDLASQCDVILLCVQTDRQCINAVTGESGLLSRARSGSCIVVLSTVLPETVQALATQAAEKGVDIVDTPVAGRGMFSIEEGTMSALVGDDDKLFERIKPVLSLFCSEVIPAGAIGSGAALKLAHNIVVYAGFAAMIEAVELARAAGVSEGLLEKVATSSGALSKLSAFFMPHYQHRRDHPHNKDEDALLQVAAALVEKDLGDAAQLAREHGINLPVAELVSGFGSKIFSTDN